MNHYVIKNEDIAHLPLLSFKISHVPVPPSCVWEELICMQLFT